LLFAAADVLPVVWLEPRVNIWLNVEEKKPSSVEGLIRQGVKKVGPTEFRDLIGITTYFEGPGFKPRPDSHLYLSESQVLRDKMYLPIKLQLLPFTCSSIYLWLIALQYVVATDSLSK
jgi:hypothetical protein